ncbi:hypothetical protein LZ686_16640 [Paracoccus sp. NFXS7]|uniref:hypothetical protein n=1 Tax=Paracoccus sp. NFXS7 TaxID=2908653 RepID=UPI0032DF1DB5
MKGLFGRTQNFSKRIAVEREALSRANLVSDRLACKPLLGLNDAAISVWVAGLLERISDHHLSNVEYAVRELARGTGLLSDESRCAVAEGKISADFPELLVTFQGALDNLACFE